MDHEESGQSKDQILSYKEKTIGYGFSDTNIIWLLALSFFIRQNKVYAFCTEVQTYMAHICLLHTLLH
jgi:hypothetical protein